MMHEESRIPVPLGRGVVKRRNAVDLRHLPEGTHCLAHRPGSLARLAFQNWSAWQDSHLQPSRFERDGSANWATRGWCPRSELQRYCARFKCAVSALDYKWAKWCRVRDFHPQPLRPKRSASGSWANAAKNCTPGRTLPCNGGSKPPALIT